MQIIKPTVILLILSSTACQKSADMPACAAVVDAKEFILGSDKNEDNAVTLIEFVNSLRSNSSSEITLTDEFLADTFDGYDLNDDGRITIAEMQAPAQEACGKAGER